ncbi:MAG: hypothetical protein OSJ74_08700 [Clostridia bacterium]|nr:hypothetical protein [Clostridia bacterium]
MNICPFTKMQCNPNGLCALAIKNECAFVVIARQLSSLASSSNTDSQKPNQS